MRKWTRALVVLVVTLVNACASPSEPVVLIAPEITAFSLQKALNPQLPSDVQGEIRGDTIQLVIPAVVAVDSLVPVFALSETNAAVRIGSVTQRSGQSRVDFRSRVTYVVTTPTGATKEYLVDVVVFTGLPVITITTDGGAPILNRVDYVNATIEIFGGKERPEWSLRGTTQIRGRGNSTWYAPKKPYRLKLTTATSLFGFPADRDWALLANYWDLTLARNALAFEFSRQVGMAYTPRCTPVELVLNGQHQGSYQLCDHQEVAADRIPAGPTGWHLELTSVSRLDPGEVFFSTPEVQAFSQEWGTSVWVYKQPDPPTTAQRSAIEAQMLRAESVLYGAGFADPDTGYAAYFDVESVIDWYLVMELTKNNDATFFNGVKIYRTATGKITFGSLWDFDLAFGGYGYDAAPTGWRIKYAAWIERFFEDRAFIGKLKVQWRALHAKRAEMDAYLLAYSRQVWFSQRLTHARWYPYETRLEGIDFGSPFAAPAFRSFDQSALFNDANYVSEVNAMRTWLDARWAWLNTNILDY